MTHPPSWPTPASTVIRHRKVKGNFLIYICLILMIPPLLLWKQERKKKKRGFVPLHLTSDPTENKHMNHLSDRSMWYTQVLVFYAAFVCMTGDFIYIPINRFLQDKGLGESCAATCWSLQYFICMIKQIWPGFLLSALHISKLDPHWHPLMQWKAIIWVVSMTGWYSLYMYA